MSLEPDHRASDYFTRTERPEPLHSIVSSESAEDEHAHPADLIIVPGRMTRVVAALSYLGVLGLVIFIAGPNRRFSINHSRVALPLHMLRFLWVGGILFTWWRTRRPEDLTYESSHLLADASLLLVIGLPRGSTLQSDVFPWISSPLAVMWLFSLIGFILALSGRSADFTAFASANWGDVIRNANWWRRRAAEERRRARLARQRQLERLQRTTMAMGVERERRERRGEISELMNRLQAEREHIDQLLGLGEISRRRYDSLSENIEAELEDLQAELNEISKRSANPRKVPDRLRVGRLERTPESDIDSIAFVTPSGVPLFTYGHFQLDEAIVAGILSAFDSITEEVFGSRVHKTELAEGQVLHFAHGEHVVVLAIFTDEPSPRQIEQLRTMAQQFEMANNGPLARQQYDPNYLHEVQIPFRFNQRV